MKSSLESVRGALLVLAAASIWGTWSLFLRPVPLSARETGPLIFMGMALFATLLLPLERTTPQLSRSVLWMLLAHGVFDALNVWAFFGAMSTTTVAIAVLTHYVAPVLVSLAAPLVDRERVPGARLAAVAALAGLVLVLGPWRAENRSDGVVLGASLGLLSAVAYAANVLVVRRLVPKLGATRTLAWHSVISAVLLAPFASFSAIAACPPHALEILALGVLLPGTFAGLLFAWGLPSVGSSRAAVLAFIEPIVAVGIGVLVFEEAFSPLAVVGGALVIAAGAVVARAKAVPIR